MRSGLVVAMAAVVTIAWIWNPGHAPRFDTADVGLLSYRSEVDGQAPKGVCYRVLVPWLAKAAQVVAPDGWGRSFAKARPLNQMDLDSGMMPAYAVAGVVAFCGHLAFGLVCGPLAMLLLWASIGPHGGVGDPVTIGAFAVAVWALLGKRAGWFWCAFVVAALNRETAPLLLIFYALKQRSVSVAMFAAVAWFWWRLLLAVAYQDNSMSMCWYELEHNLKMIQPLSLTTTVALVVGGAVMWRGMRDQAPWFRHGFLLGLILLFAMSVLWSRPERARNYLEVLPMAAIAFRSGISQIYSRGN